MKTIIKIYSIIFLSLAITSCNNKEAKVSNNDADTTVFRVKTIEIKEQLISKNIDYTANLLAFEEIHYAPASPGRIEQINVVVGSRVKPGDVIARMDRTQLIQATEQLNNARSNFQRMDTLYKLRSISEQQYEAAKTNYEIAKNNVEFLNKNTTLLSPIHGIVTGKYFESGELYSGAPNTSAGKAAIVTLMQINPLKAKVNISEKYFPLIKTGMEADVKVDVYADRQFTAQVFRIYPTISTDTRSFPVEFVIKNNDEALRPGMFARVSLDLGEINALVIPALAVVKQQGTNDYYVFKANDDNTAEKIKINLGRRIDDLFEINSELIKEGDKIIISGQEKLLNGSRIKVMQ